MPWLKRSRFLPGLRVFFLTRYIPEKPLDIVPDACFKKNSAGHFIVPDKGFTFRGQTAPGTAIHVEERDGPFRARVIPGQDGMFSISFFLEKSSGTFLFILTDPAGRTAKKELTFDVR